MLFVWQTLLFHRHCELNLFLRNLDPEQRDEQSVEEVLVEVLRRLVWQVLGRRPPHHTPSAVAHRVHLACCLRQLSVDHLDAVRSFSIVTCNLLDLSVVSFGIKLLKILHPRRAPVLAPSSPETVLLHMSFSLQPSFQIQNWIFEVVHSLDRLVVKSRIN